MFWDFISLRPETTHQVCFLFADRGVPNGYRHMNGYGSHTFKMVNAKNEPVYCKFHFKVYSKVLHVLYFLEQDCCHDFEIITMYIEYNVFYIIANDIKLCAVVCTVLVMKVPVAEPYVVSLKVLMLAC